MKILFVFLLKCLCWKLSLPLALLLKHNACVIATRIADITAHRSFKSTVFSDKKGANIPVVAQSLLLHLPYVHHDNIIFRRLDKVCFEKLKGFNRNKKWQLSMDEVTLTHTNKLHNACFKLWLRMNTNTIHLCGLPGLHFYGWHWLLHVIIRKLFIPKKDILETVYASEKIISNNEYYVYALRVVL